MGPKIPRLRKARPDLWSFDTCSWEMDSLSWRRCLFRLDDKFGSERNEEAIALQQSSTFQIKKHSNLTTGLRPLSTNLLLRCIFLVVADTELVRHRTCNFFLPFHGMSFHFLDGILLFSRVVNFDEVLYIFSFVIWAFSVTSKKSTPNLTSQRYTPMFSSKSFLIVTLKCRYDACWVTFHARLR